MRLIDADALMKNIEDYCGDYFCHDKDSFDKTAVRISVKTAPTIDAVPVVRCKDCKHYNTTGCSVGFGWCESMDRGVSDEFFCSYGAKMEDKQCK